MKSQRVFLFAIFLVGITFPLETSAEQRQVSWTPVTTYTDGTPIGADEALTYSVYWTDDPWLSPGSLRNLVSSLPETSITFDPTDAGMPRGQTIYFTAKSVLNTGEQSSLSTAAAWNVPVYVPSSPSNILTSNQAPWQISWDAVTTYTDGTPIGSGKTVLYTVYWTPDLWLEVGSLNQIGSPTSATSLFFDPVALGMTGYQTVYFTVKAVLGTGEESPFSGAFAWNVPIDGPIAPENMVVTDSSGDGTSGTDILSWDPVTRYKNGNSIESGKKVYYDVYWTTDPGLSADSLTPLSSSVESSSITFDPSACGMKRNHRVFFTGKSKLSTGEESVLSPGISWRVSNSGPASPSNGRAVRKNKK
jgi:hypothetical protein